MPVKQRKSNGRFGKVEADVIGMRAILETWMTGQKTLAQTPYTNQYIEYGYRQTECIKTTFLSLFTFHNESMNIWSHLIGCLCVLYAGWQVSQEMRSADRQSVLEILAFESYIVCAALCLLLSTIYHLFGFMSESTHDCLLRLDVTGIGLLVSGSFFPGVYYGERLAHPHTHTPTQPLLC
jgi:adiponectin receptor